MKLLSIPTLREVCPVKWHSKIPANGISLGIADIDFDGPIGVVDYIKSKLDKNFSFYQSQTGLNSAIIAASKHLAEKGVPNKDNSIQIIEGTMMGIYITMKWISEKNGDLAILGPIYEPIHRHANDTGNTINWVEINNEGINTEMLKDKVSKNTKMIVICNPSNPNGHVFDIDELKLISDLAHDFDLFVFSDELYEPLTYDQKHISIASLPGMGERSILLYGFSKAYGLAGFRSGFMYLGSEEDELHNRSNSIMVSPSPLASIVCEYALTSRFVEGWIINFRKTIKETTRYAANKFARRGVSCKIPSGCFFVFPYIGLDDVKFEDFALEKYGVQIIAGSKFGPMGKGYIRVNCATSIERLDKGIDLIFKAIADFKL